MRVTLQEIARRAGVSVITASRALSNHPDVSAETRARVSAIAAELDYVPNAHARALAGGDSRTLGLIVADNANPYYARMIRGVEETARQAGYGVILCNTNEDPDDELAAHRLLRQKRVDGVLITSVQSGSAPLRRLEQEGTPFVLLNRYVRDLEADCVLNDNYAGAYAATKVLCGLGHRRILHLTGSERITSVYDRLAGYRQALIDHGIAFLAELVVHCDLRLEDGYRQARLALSGSGPAATAVFAYSDVLALGVLRATRELGLRVPQDIALVGYDDVDFAAFTDPPLTTMAQMSYDIGQRGTQILLEKMEHPRGEPWTPRRIVLEPELRLRASSGGPIASA